MIQCSDDSMIQFFTLVLSVPTVFAQGIIDDTTGRRINSRAICHTYARSAIRDGGADVGDGARVDGADGNVNRDADDHRRIARFGALLMGCIDLSAGVHGEHAAVWTVG